MWASCPSSCLHKSRSARRVSEARAQRRGNGSRLQKTTALAAQARLLPHRAIEKPALTQPFPAAQQQGFCLNPRSGQFSCILGGRRPLTYTSSEAHGLGLAQMEVKPRCVRPLTSVPAGCLLTVCSPDGGRTMPSNVPQAQMATASRAGPPLRQQWTETSRSPPLQPWAPLPTSPGLLIPKTHSETCKAFPLPLLSQARVQRSKRSVISID